MLSKILSKSHCASCKFCCSFKRESLWELPTFHISSLSEISKSFPDVVFKKLSDDIFTLDFSHLYLTKNPSEEVPCPFLNKKKGCVLSDDLKPFDCKIWPFRIMKKDNNLGFAISKSCPSLQNFSFDELYKFFKENLLESVKKYISNNENSIKEYNNSCYFWEF